MTKMELSEEALEKISGGVITFQGQPAEYLETTKEGVFLNCNGETLKLEWNGRALAKIQRDPGFIETVHKEFMTASADKKAHALEELLG